MRHGKRAPEGTPGRAPGLLRASRRACGGERLTRCGRHRTPAGPARQPGGTRMSKYNTFDEVRFKDRDCLVAALGELGYGPETIEEGAGLHLFGYAGDRRPETAELVIRRRHVGGASNDLGFRREEDGTYVPIVSDYDVGYLARRHAPAPGETFLAKLQVAYDYQGALAFARRQERLLHRRVAVQRQLTGD